MSRTGVRVGCDLVDVGEVGRMYSRHGGRYLRRVHGIGPGVTAGGDVDLASLAADFAAKESVAKALDVGSRPLAWSDIGVGRGASGRPEISLAGRAAEYAQDMGVVGWDVSLTHERSFAMAVVVCTLRTGVGDPATVGIDAGTAVASGARDRMRGREGMRGVDARVRKAVGEALGGSPDISGLRDGDDLFVAGMTSHQSVGVMLAVEDEFDIEFPDELLTRDTFSSIATISAALGSVG